MSDRDLIAEAAEVETLAALIKKYRGILQAIADAADFDNTYVRAAPELGIMIDAPRYTDSKRLSLPFEAHADILAAIDSIVARRLAQAELLLSVKLK